MKRSEKAGVLQMKRIYRLAIVASLLLFVFSTKAQSIPKWGLADLQNAISKSEKPTVINFWASFCKPCVAEIPYFQEAVKRYDSLGVNLILVSLDLPEAYKKLPAFAKKFGFNINAITFLDESNADLFCPVVDPKWSGAIPVSLFLNNQTGYRKFFDDAIPKEQFERELKFLVQSKN